MSAPSPVATATPTIVSRIIPGAAPKPASAPKTRTRNKKKSTIARDSAVPSSGEAAEVIDSDVAKEGDEDGSVTPAGLGLGLINGNGVHKEEVSIPSKKTSAVSTVNKRIKALTKKIQRVSGYETSTEPLNADQKKAITTKPALEATLKELQELLGILEKEEAEDEERIRLIKLDEEVRVQARVKSAIDATKKFANADLTLLLQFFHLNSLFHQQSDAITIPPVVLKATSEEKAAVYTLHDTFVNGPLTGADDAAIAKVALLRDGSDVEVSDSISFGRIKEMIVLMMSPPTEEVEQDAGAELRPDSDEEQEPSTTDGATNGGLSFLQASELDTPRGDEAAPSSQEVVTEESTWVQIQSIDATTAEAPIEAEIASSSAPNGWGTLSSENLDWSQDAEAGLPEVPSFDNHSKPASTVDDDGFQQAPGRGARAGHRGARGNWRGGERGRGGEWKGRGEGRGRGTGRGDNEGGSDREHRGGRGGRGGFRRGGSGDFGGGRGEFRGGRGGRGFRGGNRPTTEA